MRKFLGLIVLLLLSSAPMMAQDTPWAEVFGGYSYWRADVSHADQAYNGWNVSVSQNLNSWFGGVLDVSGHYAQPAGFNANVHSFMYGPLFTYRKSSTVTPFAHVMLGAVRGSVAYLGLSETKVDFGAAFGGGVDLKFNRHAAIRLVQADYILTPFFNVRQSNLRLSAGLVFYLGHK
jgi:hypothetical protein